jgi:hypothetical protein
MTFLIIGAVLSLGLLILAYYNFRRKRLIDDTPTSKTQGVFIGMTELKGTAESDIPLTAYLSGLKCVSFKWSVEEEWSKIVSETYHDSQGRTQTRTRTEHGWQTIDQGGLSIPFYLKDDTGIVRINPQGASITDLQTFYRFSKPDDELYYAKGPLSEIAHSVHRRRFRENAILLHSQIYVMGQARERDDVVAAEVAADKQGSVFLISIKTEKQISSSYGRNLWISYFVGMLLAIGGALGWRISSTPPGSIWPIIGVSILIYLGFSCIGWIWMVYNSLVILRQRTLQAWSQLDIQLKRRRDLIPNLVKVIEGYKTHETETQKVLSELRTQMVATPPGISGPDYHGVIPTIRAVVENYPELKANALFLMLQNSLTESEQRIALARDYYNNIVTFYNTRLQIVPERYLATITGFYPKLLLTATDFERAVVKVSLT